MKIVVKIREFVGKILKAGEHLVTIAEASVTVSKVSDSWKDQTPQLEVKFKDEKGSSITHWFQLKGFKQAKDYPNGKAPAGIEFRNSENGNEQYAVDKKTGKRIEDSAKTETCGTILGEFLGNCGLEVDEEFDLNDVPEAIKDCQVGIKVRERADEKVEYHYSMMADDVRLTEDAEA
jgi:hypothetical protein